MRHLLLLGLLLLPFAAHADDAAPIPATPTVKVAGLDVSEASLLFTPKPDHVHVLVDAFPYLDTVKALGAAFTWKAFATSLAKQVIFPRYATATAAVIDVVELPGRDDYGAPRWDKLIRIGTFLAAKKHGVVTVKERPAPAAAKG